MINEVTATDKALELFSFKVKEGRLPEKANEVAMEKWVLTNIDKNARIGDVIKINNKNSKLVGFLANNIQSQINNKVILLYKSNEISMENAGLLIEISTKTNLKAAIKEFKRLGKNNKVSENTLSSCSRGSRRQ